MKRIIGWCMILLLLWTVPQKGWAENAEIQIGDYMLLGEYLGAQMLWRCVDIDANGPFMLADQVICIKPFDAGGAG